MVNCPRRDAGVSRFSGPVSAGFVEMKKRQNFLSAVIEVGYLNFPPKTPAVGNGDRADRPVPGSLSSWGDPEKRNNEQASSQEKARWEVEFSPMQPLARNLCQICCASLCKSQMKHSEIASGYAGNKREQHLHTPRREPPIFSCNARTNVRCPFWTLLHVKCLI